MAFLQGVTSPFLPACGKPARRPWCPWCWPAAPMAVTWLACPSSKARPWSSPRKTHSCGPTVPAPTTLAATSASSHSPSSPSLAPTNGSAQDRKAGRTSKTEAGAFQRSIGVSILETLRVNLPEFTFSSVIREVRRWMDEGVSLLDNLWKPFLQPELAAIPILDSSWA